MLAALTILYFSLFPLLFSVPTLCSGAPSTLSHCVVHADTGSAYGGSTAKLLIASSSKVTILAPPVHLIKKVSQLPSKTQDLLWICENRSLLRIFRVFLRRNAILSNHILRMSHYMLQRTLYVATPDECSEAMPALKSVTQLNYLMIRMTLRYVHYTHI